MEENHLLRDKLSKSIYIALKKRPIDTETAEKFISKISRALEELGQSEISTNTIGTMVMEGLKELDPVAYVRFASVYRDFQDIKDFSEEINSLSGSASTKKKPKKAKKK